MADSNQPFTLGDLELDTFDRPLREKILSPISVDATKDSYRVAVCYTNETIEAIIVASKKVVNGINSLTILNIKLIGNSKTYPTEQIYTALIQYIMTDTPKIIMNIYASKADKQNFKIIIQVFTKLGFEIRRDKEVIICSWIRQETSVKLTTSKRARSDI